ncbi:MAG: hypothetical protein A3E80_01735 [Chlamydiae bacterium RIFCSPHIGHO2_12_FULL_49_9]|nr:MAG: hypothetical protein A3E80_01735 [Chlamydiae bacterium RIFCSPHIGHO2_12_FULL_49_9]
MAHTHPIGAIVNFCSNESRFLKACLEETEKFARQIIVPVCDHFFDGRAENRALLEEIYAAFPKCLFVEYPFIPDQIPKRIWKCVNPAHFWHSFSRLAGFTFLQDGIESVLFLDADEVPEGGKVAEWLDCSDYQHHTVLKMANYWYFREPSNQALKWEDSVVLAQKRAIDPNLLLKEEERDAIFDLLPGPKRRRVAGIDGEPMFHHYSWVRTQEEMLAKVSAWGHKKDRDWVALVKKEFERPFSGTDFVHGYQYRSVSPRFQISFEEPRFESRGKANVKRLTRKELLGLVRAKKNGFWSRIRCPFDKGLDF